MIVLKKELVNIFVEFRYNHRGEDDDDPFVFGRYLKDQAYVYLYLYALDNPHEFSKIRHGMTVGKTPDMLLYRRTLLNVSHFANNGRIKYI